MFRSTASSVVFLTTFLCASLGAQVQQEKAADVFPCTSPSADARTAFQDAEWQTMNGYLARASESAKRALDADSTVGIARAFWVYASAAQLTPAQRHAELDRAVADAGRASQGERLMAAAIRATMLDRIAERDALLDTLIAVAPDNAVTQLLHATYIDDVQERVHWMETLVFRYPEFAPIRNQLAYAKSSLEDLDGAIQAAQEYARLLPDHPNAHHTLAQMYQRSGQLDAALREYRRAAELDPAFANGAAVLGAAGVYVMLGDAKSARDAYLASAKLAPAPATALQRRAYAGYTWLLDGTRADAVRELDAVAREAEQAGMKNLAAVLHRHLALIDAAFGDPMRAPAELAKAAELGGDATPVQYQYSALVFATIGRTDLAIRAADALRQAAATTPSLLGASHEADAMLAVAAKNYARALDQLSLAGPSATFGRAMLADALTLTGKKANEAQARALREEIEGKYTVTALDVIARAKLGTRS